MKGDGLHINLGKCKLHIADNPAGLKKALTKTCAAMLGKMGDLRIKESLLEMLIVRIFGKFARIPNYAKIYAKHKEG